MTGAGRAPLLQDPSLIDALPGRVCIVDGGGAIAAANASWRAQPAGARSADFRVALRDAIPSDSTAAAAIGAVEAALRGSVAPVELVSTLSAGSAATGRLVVRVSGFGTEAERMALVSLVDAPAIDSALEDAVRMREELIQSIDGIVWELALDTFHFTFVSDKSIEILGYPPEAWYEDGFWAGRLHPEDRDWAMSFCSAATARKENHEFEYRFVAADGRTVWLRDVVTVVVENGTPTKLRGVMFDVTSQHETARKQRETELSYKRLVELSPLPVAVHQDGRVIACNEATVRAFGGNRAGDIVGRPIGDFVKPEARPIVAARAARVLDTGEALPPREYEFVRLDGSTFEGEAFVGAATHSGRPAVQLVIQDLTERRRTEQALRSSERMLRETLENIDLLAVALDVEGRVTFCNESLLSLTGLSHDELMGADWCETFVPRDQQASVRRVFESFFSGGAPVVHFENEIVGRNGSQHLVRWSNTHLLDSSGGPAGIAAIGEDVTLQRQAMRDLLASADQYRAILASTTDGFWLTDSSGRIHDVNENYVRMSGFTRAELLTMAIADLDAKESPADVDLHISAVQEAGTDRFETTHRRRDGSLYEVEVSTSALPTGSMVVFIRDIAARKAAEKALTDSERRLRTLVDSAPFGAHIWELDSDDRLVFRGANAAASRILRIDHAPLDGKDIDEAFPELPRQVPAAYRDVALRGGVREFEHLEYSSGRITGVFEIHATQIGPRRVAVFFKDVTERKRAETLREALYSVAESSASCEQLDELYETIHRILQTLIYAKNFFVAIKDGPGSARFDYFVDEHDELPSSIPLDGTLVGHVLRAGEPLHLPAEKVAELEKRGEIGRFGTPSVDWIGAPLERGGEIFGLLAAQSYDPTVRFTDDDLDLLGFMSSNIASAIDRVASIVALRDARDTQRAMLEGIPDAALLVDLDGRIISANGTVINRLGLTSVGDAVGKGPFDCLPPDVAAARMERLREAATTGKLVRFDDCIGESHFSVSMSPVVDAEGAVVRLAVFSRDVTDEVHAARALRESEERFRATFEQAAVGMVHTSSKGSFLRVNDRFCAIVGYTRDELLGMTFPGITHPDDLAGDLGQLARLLVGETDSFSLEKRYVRKDGGVVWVNLTVSLVRLTPTEEPTLLGVVEDITVRRRAEEQMRIRDAAIESSRTAICLADLDGSVTYANPAFLAMWRYEGDTAASLVGRQLYEFWDVPDHAVAVLDNVLAAGSWTGEFRACRADGTSFDADALTSLVYDDAGRPICMMGVFADVTERLRADRELRRFREALDASADSLYVVDRRSMKFVDVNRTAELKTGYTRDQLLSMGPNELSPRVDPDATRERFDRVLGERESIRIEATHRRADGTEFPVEVVLRAVGSDDPLIIASARDISERRKAEESLREREALFEAMFQTNNAIKLLIDPVTGTIVDANPAAATFYGYDLATLRGMPIDAINKNPPARINDGLREASARGKTFFEFRHRLANDEIRDVEVYSGPIALGGRSLLFSIVHDVTERKTSEARLRQLAIALENVPDAIYVTDPAATILYHNRALETITGFHADELVGASPRLFKSEQHDRAFYRRMWEIITEGRVWSGRVINRRKDGTIYHEQKTIAPIHDAAGSITGFVSVGRDVSEEVALEARLRESQKMEAIGQLAGGIAHDFNNLLQGIFSYLDLASLQIREEAPDAMPDIEEVRRSAARAATLTKQLLAFSRRQLLELRSIELNDLVSGFFRMIKRVMRENIELRFEPHPSATTVRVDSSQVEQVILNLCLNARDAMPEGGSLVLSTFVVDIPPDSPRLGADTPPGRYVALRVTDSGIGMDDWTRRRIFEPFFTTKGPGRGSGLGLAMVYGIVRQHRGIVEVVSAPGEGSTFTVYFPESSGETPELIDERIDTVPVGRGEVILFAEDSELIRNAVERVLRANGYRVITVVDGIDAVAAFEANRAEIKLVLMDVVMPRLSGREAYRRIHDIDPSVPVIFCSGYDPDTEQTRFIVEGGFDLLQKPFNNVSLLHKVRKQIDSRH